MPKEFGRNQRVAEFIKQELAILIQKKFPLQNYGMLTISNVDVSPDLKNAKVFFTVFSEKLPVADLSERLNSESGYFRHEISHIMTSKSVPAIKFIYDETIERAHRLDKLIDSVSKPDEQTPD